VAASQDQPVARGLQRLTAVLEPQDALVENLSRLHALVIHPQQAAHAAQHQGPVQRLMDVGEGPLEELERIAERQ